MLTKHIIQTVSLAISIGFCSSATAQSSSSSSSSCSSGASSSTASNPVTSPLTCEVQSDEPWAQGYHATVNVTNTSATAVNSWQVYLALADEHTVNHYWNAEVEGTSDQITAHNAHWNGQLQPGQSTTFGLLGSHPGNFITPTCSTTENPLAGLTVNAHDLTIHTQANQTTSQNWQYKINFGDGSNPVYDANVWHTYEAAGTYTLEVTATNDNATYTMSKSVSVSDGTLANRPPVARIYVDVPYGGTPNFSGDLSYDPDGQPITQQWRQVWWQGQAYQVLTVSDGELADTAIRSAHPVSCGGSYHAGVNASLALDIDGRTIRFDASDSLGAQLLLEYGDGASTDQVISSHTYAAPGEYTVELRVFGGPYSDYVQQTLVIE